MLTVLAAVPSNAQLLWKISGGDAKNNSYLLGTHHLAPLSMLDSISGFDKAIKEVDAIVGEVDMAKMASEMQALVSYMLAPADSTLTSLLTPAEADSLTMVLQRYMGPQISAAQFAPMKPAAVSTQLALLETMATMPEAAEQLAAGKQLDSEVQALATAAGKEVLAFETAEEQLGILMGAPLAKQAQMLMEAVRQSLSGKAAETALELTNAYKSQDLDAVASLILAEEDMDKVDVERLILARNRKWVNTLIELLPQRSVMISVGAGHLPGPEGLISLLQAKGFNVRPVK